MTSNGPPESESFQSQDLPPPPHLETRKAAGLSAAFRALRHRNFRLFFFGQFVSNLGTAIQMTALSWLVYLLTNQSWWNGLIMAAQIVPTVFLGAWGGLLADRWPRRSLLVVTQTITMLLAFSLAALTFGELVTRWWLLFIVTLIGIVQAVDFPTRLAFVGEMVEREDLLNATALNSVQFNAAMMIGPMLAGWMLASLALRGLGPGACFVANGLSYMAVLSALLCMNLKPKYHVTGKSSKSLWPRAGFVYIAERPSLALLVLMMGLMTFFITPVLVLLPAFAESFGNDVGRYSQMLSGTGAGALSAALTAAVFGPWHRRGYFIVGGFFVSCTAMVCLSILQNLVLLVASCFFVGFGLTLFFATSQGVLQMNAGEIHRGQVMGVWAMTRSGCIFLGNLFVGALSDARGAPWTMRFQGLACIVGGLLLMSLGLLRTLRQQELPPEQGSEG